MSSLISRLKSGSTPTTSHTGFSPGKKSAPAPPLTPLEKLLEDTGPLKNDGNDKFFGMHNASNTCYCNSVVQCLYYSEPFREHIINWPRKGQARSAAEDDSTIRQSNAPDSSNLSSPKKPGVISGPTSPTGTQQENRETFDYQKKLAMQGGPHLRMEKGYYDNYGMPESLFTSLKDLFEAISTHDARKGIITPTKLLELVRQNILFQGNTHQDAHEFLKVLLDEVVDQVEKYSKAVANDPEKQQGLGLSIPQGDQPSEEKAKAVSSWVHELFEGTLTSETRCLTCENVSQRDEAFLDLSIDLEAHSSVTSCLRKFSEEEMLCERNKFHCDKCSGLQEAEKRMKIKRLPQILALHLKRFEYNEDYTMLHKLFHRVVYPFHLRIFNTTDDVEDPDRIYELYAVIVHLGTTPFHGHYVSIIKTKELGWLLFDDELVLPVDKNYVRNFFGGQIKIGNETRNNPACAYVLFYQQTTEEAVQREQEAEDDIKDVPAAVSFDSQGIVASGGLEANGLLSPSIPPTPASEEVNPFTVPIEHAHTSPAAPPELEEIEEEGQPLQLSPSAEPNKGLGLSRLGSMRKRNTMDQLRSTSFTMRSKPKFWGSSKTEVLPESQTVAGPSAASPLQGPLSPPEEGQEKEAKSRFSLSRKKSKIVT